MVYTSSNLMLFINEHVAVYTCEYFMMERKQACSLLLIKIQNFLKMPFCDGLKKQIIAAVEDTVCVLEYTGRGVMVLTVSFSPSLHLCVFFFPFPPSLLLLVSLPFLAYSASPRAKS